MVWLYRLHINKEALYEHDISLIDIKAMFVK